MTTVRAALAQARAANVAALDAQLLLARLLGVSRTAVIANDDAVMSTETVTRWNGWLGRRAAGEPLAYLIGEKEFRGLRLEVTPDVLVPRPETELLIDWALEVLPLAGGESASRQLSAIDLGTGSGAIAIALASARPDLAMVAADVSSAALDVARRNSRRLGVVLEVVETSWWSAFEGLRFDLALANPPYVVDDDPALAALHHEPRGALTPGADGLAALREVALGAPEHLAGGAWLLLEHGASQGEAVRRLLAESGFDGVETRRDLAGRERASGGRLGAGRGKAPLRA